MKNLGIATPTVHITSKLPNVGDFATKTNFDVSAHSWGTLQNSPYFTPLLTEALIDPDGTFAIIHPSKRVFWADNLLAKGDRANGEGEPQDGDLPRILWTQIDANALNEGNSIMKKIVKDYLEYTVIPPNEQSAATEDTYNGPVWRDNTQNKETVPNDLKTISDFFIDMANSDQDSGAAGDSEEIIDSIGFVWQERSLDGLWWGMESTAFLKKNMPFWITIKTMQPPTSADHDTLFVISLGLSDEKNRFDIFLPINQKPKIIDWLGGEANGTPEIQKEFEVEGSRLWSTDQYQRIGVMTVAGRLVVIVNGYPLVYTRINKNSNDNGGKLFECAIAEGAIRIFGTNSQCSFNVSYMSFAQFGAIAIPVPKIVRSNNENEDLNFKGVDHNGDQSASVCHLPTPPSEGEQRFGCDCLEFKGSGGSAAPKGFGFHSQGEITFSKADESTFEALPSTEFYVLTFKPQDVEFGDGKIPYGGAPYYFRLKGLSKAEEPDLSGPIAGDITRSVISINETATAPDYFHVKKSLDVTCYDENGALQGLLRGQTGIQVSWGWSGSEGEEGAVENRRTFTGVVTSVSTSQKAGMETISIRAEDYSHIIKNTLIINSPFYDGMVAFHAIRDMASRASLLNTVNDWESPNDYFLPAGYSFSQPAVRYSGTQSIFDCMMDIVKRFEAIIYFNEEGQLVVNRLPGGLFSQADEISAEFKSNDLENTNFLMLEERQIEVNYDSTVNIISAMTLDRDTRNPILYVRSARGEENHLLYKRTALLNQAALGELEVCINYCNDLAKRVFAPILKTRWKTVGTGVDLKPLDFVNVDGVTFRVMSLKRSYNADNNDLTTSYEGEWKGGSQL